MLFNEKVFDYEQDEMDYDKPKGVIENRTYQYCEHFLERLIWYFFDRVLKFWWI